MGSPTIFAGRRTKTLTTDGLLLRSGATIDNDGPTDIVKNGRFEAELLPWEAYQNTAGTSPLNGTGGTPGITFVRSTSSPLSGIASGLCTKDAVNRQGEGFSIAGDSPVGWQGKVIQVQFDAVMAAGYNGTTETMDVFVYDVTNSALLTAVGNQRVATGASQFSCNFINSASSTNLRVICHISGTGTAAWTMKIDDVRCNKMDVTGATMKEFYNAGRVQIPSGAGTLVTTAAAQVLENKTLEVDTTLLVDATDNTKALDFDLSLATTAKKLTLQSQHTDDRTIQIPDADTTLIGNDTDGILTNKDIDGGVATDASRITLPAETTANLAALTRKEGTIAWDSTTKKVVADDGTSFNIVGQGAGTELVHTVTNADYTILDNDGYTTILVSTGATDRTITLPTLAANLNRAIRIKKIDNGIGKVIVDGESTETIDGATTKELINQYDETEVQAGPTEWSVLNKLISATTDELGQVTSYAPIVKSSVHLVTSANYTILDDDGFETIVVSTSSSNRTVTLPAVANNPGRKIRIIKADSAVGNVLLDAAGSELLNGLTVPQIACGTQYDTYDVICDSALGWIIDQPSAQSYSLTMDGSFSAGTINIRKFGQVVIMEVNTMIFGSSAAPAMSSAISPIFAPTFDTSAIVSFTSARVVSLECTAAGIVSLTFRDWAGNGTAQTSLAGCYTLTWLKRG